MCLEEISTVSQLFACAFSQEIRENALILTLVSFEKKNRFENMFQQFQKNDLKKGLYLNL